jgi:hypothetical protein
MIAGVDKHYVNVPSLGLGGASYTPAELKSIFQGEIDAEQALEDARAKVRQLMGSTRMTRAKARALRKLVRAYVLTTAGSDAAQMLADFGIKPTASKPKVETKAQAVVKAQATRKARHTMGKNQKKSVKGSVPTTPSVPKPV